MTWGSKVKYANKSKKNDTFEIKVLGTHLSLATSIKGKFSSSKMPRYVVNGK